MLDLPCRIPLDPRDSSASQTLEHVAFAAFGYMYYVVPASPLGSWLVLCSSKCGDVDVKFGASLRLQSKTAGAGGGGGAGSDLPAHRSYNPCGSQWRQEGVNSDRVGFGQVFCVLKPWPRPRPHTRVYTTKPTTPGRRVVSDPMPKPPAPRQQATTLKLKTPNLALTLACLPSLRAHSVV